MGVSVVHVLLAGVAAGCLAGLAGLSDGALAPNCGVAASCGSRRIGCPFWSLLIRSRRLRPEPTSDTSEDVLESAAAMAGLPTENKAPPGCGVATPPLATTLGSSLWLTSCVSDSSSSDVSSASASAFSFPLPLAELASERYPKMLACAEPGFRPPSSTDLVIFACAGLDAEAGAPSFDLDDATASAAGFEAWTPGGWVVGVLSFRGALATFSKKALVADGCGVFLCDLGGGVSSVSSRTVAFRLVLLRAGVVVSARGSRTSVVRGRLAAAGVVCTAAAVPAWRSS